MTQQQQQRRTPSLRAPEVRTFGLEIREAAVSTSGKFLEGRAVPYGEWTDVGWYLEQHEFGSMSRTIAEAAKGLPLLLWHDSRTWPVGVSDEWRDNEAGLDGVWRLDGSQEAQRAAQLANDGMLTGMSIGFAPIRSEWEYAQDWNPELGPEFSDRVTRKESRLLEVSLTPTPAFAGAQVSLVRTAATNQHRSAGTPQLDAWRSWRESVRR